MAFILDGCCGAGGATRGYTEAGHLVWGVDSNPALEQDYLKSGGARFLAADILETLARPGIANFDLLHVSPPCQTYSKMSRCRPGLAKEYPDLIGPVRELLIASGRPYVIENVEGAPLRDPTILCCFMFGRPGYRHRWFETGGGFTLPEPPKPPVDIAAYLAQVGDYEMKATDAARLQDCGWPHPVATAKAGYWQPGMFVSVAGHERKAPTRLLMEIDWMRRREDIAEAIPPYLSAWIGRQVVPAGREVHT